jgi:hypothetical protein
VGGSCDDASTVGHGGGEREMSFEESKDFPAMKEI